MTRIVYLFSVVFALGILLCTPAFASDYFQQEVHYKIGVKLDDVKHELTGDIVMEYTNHSPDRLDVIYMHIWANAYKNQKSALAKQLRENGDLKFHYSQAKDRGYMDSIDFKVNGTKVTWSFDPKNPDIAIIKLAEPLYPGAKIVITTPFHVKIPKGVFSRLGHMGQSYQITQWYPKPAVYDANGWNQMPYLTMGEFYSEYGSFDVSITLPKNYVVGATGDLVDGESEIAWLTSKSEATSKIEKFERDMSFPASDANFKTLRYKQKDVHDFGWFADKRYHVLKGEVELPYSKKKVTTWAMFTNNEAHLWKNASEYLHDAVFYYSKWLGDYPYNQVTAVDGALSAGGGMEYPNVTVIGESGNKTVLEITIMHEVGHNWFYGILGSNERMHAWMDEGLNSFYEKRYIETKYPELKLTDMIGSSPTVSMIAKLMDMEDVKHKSYYELSYLINARRNLDQPMELASDKFTTLNYGGVVYSKSALVFSYLKAYLGEEKMDAVMQKYYETWKFKHPQPDDMRKVLETETGKDLKWLFHDMIKTGENLDYAITCLKKDKTSGKYIVTLRNRGGVDGPVSISGVKDNKAINTLWVEGFSGKKKIQTELTDVDFFRIDKEENMPETNRKDNIMRTRGILRKLEPFSFRFPGALERPERTQVFYSPVLGWNNYNKFLLGAIFYNNLIPQKKMEYVVMPMFGTGNKSLAGSAQLAYNLFPELSYFQNVRFSLNAFRYGYSNMHNKLNYNVLTPELTLDIKKTTARSPISQTFRFRRVMVWEDVNVYSASDSAYGIKTNKYYVNDFTQNITNSRKINPFSLNFNVQQGKGFAKTSVEGLYRISFKGRNKGMDIRAFAGKFFIADNPGNYRYRMSGQRGWQDYTYDGIFLGRTETSGLLSQQMLENDGAFKVYTPIGQTSDWLIAINIKSSIHRKLPIKVFADIGTYSGANVAFPGSKRIAWDAGLMVSIVPNVIDVYFPLLMSSELKESSKFISDNNYWRTIRFTMNLDRLNPLKLVRTITI